MKHADKRTNKSETYTVKAGMYLEDQLFAVDKQPYSSKEVAQLRIQKFENEILNWFFHQTEPVIVDSSQARPPAIAKPPVAAAAPVMATPPPK